MGKSKLLKKYLPELIYGGFDGCITTFAVVAGSVGADLNSSIIIVLGLANLLADGFAMSIGAYLSANSQIEEELSQNKSAVLIGAYTYLAFVVVGFIPLVVYIIDYFTAINLNLFSISVGSTLIGFLVIGLLKSYINTKKNPIKGIIETVLLGIIAATVAYSVGRFLKDII